MQNRKKLWRFLSSLKEEESEQFGAHQVVLGFLELFHNRVFMEQLRNWKKFDQSAILELLVLDKDRKDIEKARLLGRLEIVGAILEKIEHARKVKDNQK